MRLGPSTYCETTIRSGNRSFISLTWLITPMVRPPESEVVERGSAIDSSITLIPRPAVDLAGHLRTAVSVVAAAGHGCP